MADLKFVTGLCLLMFLQMRNYLTEGCSGSRSPKPGGKKTGAYPDCNFKNGFGGWANQDKRRWKIVNSTRSYAGLLAGRQGVDDSFAVIDSFSSWYKYAKLYSHDITGPVCMRFYFYLYGNETGYLKIRTKRKYSSYEMTSFNRYGNHGHKWNLAQIYLNFARTSVYQIIIWGKVGDSKSSIAIDDISFQNHTCDRLPKASTKFNCTFDSGTCGWKLRGYSGSRFDHDLNQYVFTVWRAELRSPRISERDVCFAFEYHVDKSTKYNHAGIYVFINDANNSQLLPMWSKRGYYDRGKWYTVKIRLRYQNGFNQVEIRNVPFSSTYFANFYITPEIDDCSDIVDEKTFFVSIKKISPMQHRISEDGVHCDNYPTSEFIASTIPSEHYPKPMYLFTSSRHIVLRQTEKTQADDLLGYFYVSLIRHEDSSAIYYKTQSDKYGQFIAEFRTTALDGNWTANVMYVKNHQSHKGNGNCPPGYLTLGKKDKCFWLMCGDSSNSESRCSEKLGTLASLDTVSSRRASEYLEYIKATSIGINQVTVGLSNNGHRWIWRDGRVYNDSDGLLRADINTKAFLSWKEKNNSWVIKSGDLDGVRLHLCEEQGENIAYKSKSNQSSTSLGLSSQFAVDGLSCTYSSTRLPGKSFSKSWWKVALGKATKIFLVQITWRAESKIGKVTMILERDGTQPNFVKELTSDEKSIITCGPPLPARYLRIEREKEALEIYEVDVHATDSVLDNIQGVMRSAWENKQGMLTTDHVFNLASFFKVRTDRNKQQKLEAYILAPYDSVYKFTFHGNVDANLVISRHKDADDSLMKHSFNESGVQRYFKMKRFSTILLEACKFYYVKLITSSTYYSYDVFLNIEHKNSSNWMPIETRNLFWVLPGQLEVKLLSDNSTKESVPLTYPVNLTGRYSIKCLGLYCGDCPLAIFLYFAGYIECTVTSSRSIAQADKITLRIVKNWFAHPGLQPIQMGYKTNEDCQSIKMNTERLDLTQSSGLQEVGKINVKALTVIACDFAESRLCENGNKKSTFFIYGWSRAEDFDLKGRKVNALAMSENMTSRFSYDGVPYNWIVERTGICMKFRYKITGDNNTLSLSFKTSSGHISLLWRLRGNHGDLWKTGGISYMPNESFAFIFEGSISEPNSTVAITNILITTEHCKQHSGVFPHFADPDSKCDSNKFLCDNGECIGHSFVCDGDPRCADGSDEKDCQCLADQFRCLGSGECVEKRFMCNGIANCDDASDEKDCYEGCDPKQFYCPSGVCIPWNSTCNGVRDCLDGADEPRICGNTTKTNQTCSLDNLGCLDEVRSDEMCAKTTAHCDFEHGLTFCHWHQVNDGSDDFDWSIGKGETSSKKTGPITDHTTGTNEGSYVYIEASSPRVAGDKATLSAGPFRHNLNFCFTFHYHMFGRHIGRLSVLQSGRNKTNVKALWTRNISRDIHWKTASIDLKSTEIFYLFIEAVRGDGSQGDIAVDDISMVPKNCSEVHNEISPFCSFEKPCSWKKTPRVWSRTRVNNKNQFMLQDHFLKTRSSGKLELVLSKEVIIADYQCMTFWYKSRYTTGMTFKTMQLYDWNMIELSHSLRTANEQWVFGEMPLKRDVMKSKLVIKVTIPSQKNFPYLGIDEINFSREMCLSFQQGDIAWIRKSLKFYNSSKKRNSDGSITAIHYGEMSPESSSALTSLRFLETIPPDHVNYVVEDIRLLDYTNISLGTRVLINEHVGFTAVPGIVIAKKTAFDASWPRFLLTVRFDINSSDIEVEEQDALLLPYQLDRHGPAWLTSFQDCESQRYNDTCYFVLQKRNWFDGADDCKIAGGEIARFDSELEEKHARKTFAKFLPFWIGFHGHKYHGKKFVWSDGKKDLYNNLDRGSLDKGLSAGLCVMITNSSLWERQHCSELLNVVCRRPDVRKITISKDQGNKTLNCSNLDAVIDILGAKLIPDMLELSRPRKYTGDKVCKLKPDLTVQVKTKCQFGNWCTLSVKSILNRSCPNDGDNLTVLYKCVKNSDEINPGNSRARSVFCPNNWQKFRTSCYKASSAKITWDKALEYCKRVQGASLVSFNDKKEEEYVTKIMESNGIKIFHTWPRPQAWSDLERVGFMCEYKLGDGSCDFETDWCGWIDFSHDADTHWYRAFEKEQKVTSIFSFFGIPQKYLQPSHDKVDIYLFQGNILEEMFLNADRPKEIKQITLCVWVFIATKNQTKVNVVSFGEKLRLKIYFESEYKYRVNFHDWNGLTTAFVSFETWQHLCFSVDTQAMLWKFFEDGLMTDIGTFNLSQSYVTDQSAGDNIIKLGKGSCSEATTDELKKSKCNFRGKMTKPNVWSRALEFHEISVLATGCETTGSPDIATEQAKFSLVRTLSFRNGECISGKGTRLTTSKIQNSSLSSTPVLLSPWMNVPFERVRGVCMHFNYRLVGKNSELAISVEPRNMDVEMLWFVKGPQGNKFWKNGQVSLGLVSEFRVYITATLWSVGSEANIDNIFFMEDYCDPVPSNAQEWDTKSSGRFSGSIKSPYYPGLYLNNMRRSWTIEVPKGHRVALFLQFLNLEFQEQCKRDIVVLSSHHSKIAYYTCGNVLPSEPFVSAGNTVFIQFMTDERDVGTGFMLEYRAIPDDFVESLCLTDRVPDCHSTVICSKIRSNSSEAYVDATDLVAVPEYLPATTTVINFDHNHLIKLDEADFENLTQLEYLSCIDNKIFDVDQKAFQTLASLQTLRLSQNFIKSISTSLFLHLYSLETLDLSKNRIHELETGSFPSLNNLRTLSLRMNFLRQFRNGVFTGLSNLQYLYLDNNELREMEDSVFDDLTVIKTLILNNNKLEIIKSSWLKNKKYLETLEVGKNKIKEIESGAFRDLRNLVKLDLSDNQLQSIPEDLFESLVSLRYVKVDHFTLCCYAKQINPSVNCVSKAQDGFSSCDELLKNTILKYSIWILGVMAFAGNLIVIIWRSIARDSNKVNSFLLTNLAVADFLMGVYMLIIAYKDTAWDGVYFKHDFTWRASDLCIFAGVISTVSSEVSVITLTVITVDRLVCIVFPFRFHRWSMKKAASIMCFVWILGLCISLAPLFHDSYFYDFKNNVHFFGRSAVCLPLQLSSDRPSGWQYSVSIFLILNGVSFIFILLAYVFMYRTIVKAANAVRSTRMNQDSTLAKRMMFIILTDFFCWFPVIIISILALTGNLYDPSKQVYAWIAVFVLPINSSINPLLYTFSTPYVRKKIPTASRALSRSRGGRRGTPRRYSSEVSIVSNLDHTIMSPLSTPRSIHKLDIIDEGYSADDNMAESSFTESASATEYRVKIVEDVQNLTDDGHEIIKSCLAVDVDGEETPCMIHIYKNESEAAWRTTTNILSWLSLDGGHDNILQFLWSAKGASVYVERSDSLAGDKLDIEPDDCLVCYELPSRLTLKKLLEMDHHDITEETVYCIFNDLMEAIDFLSSKQIVHGAILPENIILVESPELTVESAILGGLHATKFIASTSEEKDLDDEFGRKNMEEALETNVTAFGNVIQIFLQVCPLFEKFTQLHNIMESCLSDTKPTTSDLLEQLALMDPDYPASDKVL